MIDSRRVLRMGMVGGGPGAFIGPVHRMAAELDGRIRLVAGAFASTPERSFEGARTYAIDPARAYSTYAEMIAKESARDDGIELVCIATPNHLHFPVARVALQAGLHVISDKPATLNVDEALELRNIVVQSGREYALTFTYTGYALVRAARDLVQSHALGIVRKVVVEYLQGWLSEPIEETGQKQAAWRSDPKFSGVGGCIADIGVHAFNLLEYITGLKVQRLSADLRATVPGRKLDDDSTVLAVLDNGAHAIIAASQIAAGERNYLRIRIYGERAGLEWQQESPAMLRVLTLDGREEVLHAGSSALSPSAKSATRLPSGHPEGLVEALATIYSDFALTILAPDQAQAANHRANLCGIEDGVRSMAFVENAIRSSGQNWHALKV